MTTDLEANKVRKARQDQRAKRERKELQATLENRDPMAFPGSWATRGIKDRLVNKEQRESLENIYRNWMK